MLWLLLFLVAYAPDATIQTMIDAQYDLTSNITNGALKAYFAGQWYNVTNAPIFVWVETTSGISDVCYTYTDNQGSFSVDFSSFSNIRTIYFLFCSPDQNVNSVNNTNCYPEGWSNPISVCAGGVSSPSGDVSLISSNGTVYEDWYNWGYLSPRFITLSPFNKLDDSGDSTPFMGVILVGALVAAMAIAQNPSLLGWFSFSYLIKGNIPPGAYNRTGRSQEAAMFNLVEDGSNKHITGRYLLQEVLETSAKADQISLEMKKEAAKQHLADRGEEKEEEITSSREALKKYQYDNIEDRRIAHSDAVFQEQQHQTIMTSKEDTPNITVHSVLGGIYDGLGSVLDIVGKPAEFITTLFRDVINEVEPGTQHDTSKLSVKLKSFMIDVLNTIGTGALGFSLKQELNTIVQQQVLDKSVEGVKHFTEKLMKVVDALDLKKYDKNGDGLISENELIAIKHENPAAYHIIKAYLSYSGQNNLDIDTFKKGINEALPVVVKALQEISQYDQLAETVLKNSKDGQVTLNKDMAKKLGFTINEDKIVISVEEFKEKVREKMLNTINGLDFFGKAILFSTLVSEHPELQQQFSQLDNMDISAEGNNLIVTSKPSTDFDSILLSYLDSLEGDKLTEELAKSYAIVNTLVKVGDLKQFDKDNDGKVTLSEFLGNGNGYITKEDLKRPEVKFFLTLKVMEARAKGWDSLDENTKSFFTKVFGDDAKDVIASEDVPIQDIVNPILNNPELINDLSSLSISAEGKLPSQIRDFEEVREHVKWLEENAHDFVYGQMALVDSILKDEFATEAQKRMALSIKSNLDLLAMAGAGNLDHLSAQALGNLVLLNMALAAQHNADMANQTHVMSDKGDSVLDRDQLMKNLAIQLAPVLGDSFTQAVKEMEEIYRRSEDLNKAKHSKNPEEIANILSDINPVLANQLKDTVQKLEQEMGVDYENMSAEQKEAFYKKLMQTEAYKAAKNEINKLEKEVYSVTGLALTGDLSNIANNLLVGNNDVDTYLSGDKFNPMAYYAASNGDHSISLNNDSALLSLDSQEKNQIKQLYMNYLEARESGDKDKIKEARESLISFLEKKAKEEGIENVHIFYIPLGSVGYIRIAGDNKTNTLDIDFLDKYGVERSEAPLDNLNKDITTGHLYEVSQTMKILADQGNKNAQEFITKYNENPNLQHFAKAMYYYLNGNMDKARTELAESGIDLKEGETISDGIKRGIDIYKDEINNLQNKLENVREDLNSQATLFVSAARIQQELNQRNTEEALEHIDKLDISENEKTHLKSLIKENQISEAQSYLDKIVKEQAKNLMNTTGYNPEARVEVDNLPLSPGAKVEVVDSNGHKKEVEVGLLVFSLIKQGKIEEANKIVGQLSSCKVDGGIYHLKNGDQKSITISMPVEELEKWGSTYEYYNELKTVKPHKQEVTSLNDINHLIYDNLGGATKLGISPLSSNVFDYITTFDQHKKENPIYPLGVMNPIYIPRKDTGLMDEISSQTLKEIGGWLDKIDIVGYGYDYLGKSFTLKGMIKEGAVIEGSIIGGDDPIKDTLDKTLPPEYRQQSYKVVEIDKSKSLENINVETGTIILHGDKIVLKTDEGYKDISNDNKLLQQLSLRAAQNDIVGLSENEEQQLSTLLYRYAIENPEKFREIYSMIVDGEVSLEERNRIVEAIRKATTTKSNNETKSGLHYIYNDVSIYNIEREVDKMVMQGQFTHNVWGWNPQYNALPKYEDQTLNIDVGLYLAYRVGGSREAGALYALRHREGLSQKEREIINTQALILSRTMMSTVKQAGLDPQILNDPSKLQHYIQELSYYKEVLPNNPAPNEVINSLDKPAGKAYFKYHILPLLPPQVRHKLEQALEQDNKIVISSIFEKLPDNLKEKITLRYKLDASLIKPL